MNSKFKFFALAALLVFAGTGTLFAAQTATETAETHPPQVVSRRVTFVFFHSGHCPACKFVEPGIKALREAIRGKHLFRDGKDRDLSRHKVEWIPTLIAVDSKGKVVRRFEPGDLVKAHRGGKLAQMVLESFR